MGHNSARYIGLGRHMDIVKPGIYIICNWNQCMLQQWKHSIIWHLHAFHINSLWLYHTDIGICRYTSTDITNNSHIRNCIENGNILFFCLCFINHMLPQELLHMNVTHLTDKSIYLTASTSPETLWSWVLFNEVFVMQCLVSAAHGQLHFCL
jgi:hypothetical protein